MGELASQRSLITTDEITRILAQREAGLPELKVSHQWLSQKAKKHSLSHDDLVMSIHLHDEFGAGLPNVFGFLEKGVSLPELTACYTAREVVKSSLPYHGDHGEGTPSSVSIKQMVRFCQLFPEADFDEDSLGEFLLSVHTRMVDIFPQIEYMDQSLTILSMIKEQDPQRTSVDAIMDFLELTLGRSLNDFEWNESD